MLHLLLNSDTCTYCTYVAASLNQISVSCMRMIHSCISITRNLSRTGCQSVKSFKDLGNYPSCSCFLPSWWLNPSSVSQLQLVQNAAARLLIKTQCRSHITPAVATLHWLYPLRAEFILLFIFSQSPKKQSVVGRHSSHQTYVHWPQWDPWDLSGPLAVPGTRLTNQALEVS